MKNYWTVKKGKQEYLQGINDTKLATVGTIFKKKALVNPNNNNINLLSVSMLCDLNKVVIFTKEEAFILDDNNNEVKKWIKDNKKNINNKATRTTDNLYKIKNPVFQAGLVSNNKTSLEWHTLLGHRHGRDISRLKIGY